VGCGALKITGGRIGEIKRMWTAPYARGQGVARAVIRKLEATAQAASIKVVRLETNRTLKEAQALYLKEGYRKVSPFNNEPYAHYWFEKRL
jgi:ribosomal protein S18 acetylase RimI-like enzyme